MKVIKEKPAKRMPKSNTEGKIPKAAMKKTWTEVKEKSRTKLRESISAQGNSDYTTLRKDWNDSSDWKCIHRI